MSNHFQAITRCLDCFPKITYFAVVSRLRPQCGDGYTRSSFQRQFQCSGIGDDVVKGKPDPDPYLKALEYLGADPENCIVFENAPYGVEAAKKAGIYCIGIPTYVDPQLLKMSDKVLRNHLSLMKYLHLCCKRGTRRSFSSSFSHENSTSSSYAIILSILSFLFNFFAGKHLFYRFKQ
jgi:beta-phosphoglucomutase-like phosphatase (HAD superfamily)